MRPSVDLFYGFPFERWERDVVHGAVAKVGRSLGSSYVLTVDEPETDRHASRES